MLTKIYVATGPQLVKWIYSHAIGLVNMTARSKTNIGNQLFCSLHFESFEKKNQKKQPTYFSESNKLMGMMMWIWMVSKHHLLISRLFLFFFSNIYSVSNVYLTVRWTHRDREERWITANPVSFCFRSVYTTLQHRVAKFPDCNCWPAP